LIIFVFSRKRQFLNTKAFAHIMQVSQASIYRMLNQNGPMTIENLAVQHVYSIDPDDSLEVQLGVPTSQRIGIRRAQRLVRKIASGLRHLIRGRYVSTDRVIDMQDIGIGIEARLTTYGRSCAEQFERHTNNPFEDYTLPRPRMH
jgi:hypothetical protein